MKKLLLSSTVILNFLFSTTVFANETAIPKYLEACIFKAVAAKKGITIKPEIPLPKIFFSSQITLAQYQDAVEQQYKMRPEHFVNVYVAARNEIYISDDASYFAAVHRFIDDSIAHELTHFIQVKYQAADLMDDPDDFFEGDAIKVQSWFRDNFMATGQSPCESLSGAPGRT